MLNMTKKFIREHKDLIEAASWKQFFIEAYEASLITPVVRELANILEQSGLTNTTHVRSELLYYYINSALIAAKIDLDNNGPSYSNTYAAQFLRRYLNNTFGYLENEAIMFMVDNQVSYKITMTPANDLGQRGIGNYIITFKN